MRTNHPMVRIVNGALVIRIPGRVIEFATNEHPEYWDAENDRQRIKVIDRAQWLKSVRDSLLNEEEDGSTVLTAALDKAVAYAIEQGFEGCEETDANTNHAQ